MFKLIALDIDGTLLTDDFQITTKTFQALKLAHEKGIHIVLSSGRSIPEMKEILEYLPFIHYVVCGNGSSVYQVNPKEKLYAKLVDENIILSMKKDIQHLDHMLEYYDNGKIFTEEYTYERLAQFGYEPYYDFFMNTRTIVASLSDQMVAEGTTVEKANFSFKNKEDQQKAAQLFKKYDCYVASSFHNNIEVSAVGVHKASGLDFLVNHLNITQNETIAFGDSSNDYEMLQYAKIGVAMANAGESIKAIADEITASNNEDGIALILEKYIK